MRAVAPIGSTQAAAEGFYHAAHKHRQLLARTSVLHDDRSCTVRNVGQPCAHAHIAIRKVAMDRSDACCADAGPVQLRRAHALYWTASVPNGVSAPDQMISGLPSGCCRGIANVRCDEIVRRRRSSAGQITDHGLLRTAARRRGVDPPDVVVRPSQMTWPGVQFNPPTPSPLGGLYRQCRLRGACLADDASSTVTAICAARSYAFGPGTTMLTFRSYLKSLAIPATPNLVFAAIALRVSRDAPRSRLLPRPPATIVMRDNFAQTGHNPGDCPSHCVRACLWWRRRIVIWAALFQARAGPHGCTLQCHRNAAGCNDCTCARQRIDDGCAIPTP